MTEEHNIAAGCISLNGVGVLICGASGSGKSALALSLIEKGACLVSDDRTVVFKENGCLWARAPVLLYGLLEVRGVGIVRGFQTLEKAPVKLIITLVEEETERLPFKTSKTFMGQDIYSFSFKKDDFALTNKVIVAIKLVAQELFLPEL